MLSHPTDHRLGEPLPLQLTNQPHIHPLPPEEFIIKNHASLIFTAGLFQFPKAIPSKGQVCAVLLTRTPLAINYIAL